MHRNYFHAYSPFHYDLFKHERSIDYKCSILPSFHTFNSIKPCRTQTIQNVSCQFCLQSRSPASPATQPFLCLQEPCVATISQLHRKLSIALFMKCRLQCCTGQFIKNIAFTRIHIHPRRHYIKVRTIERHKLFSGLATNMCSTNDHFYIYEPILRTANSSIRPVFKVHSP